MKHISMIGFFALLFTSCGEQHYARLGKESIVLSFPKSETITASEFQAVEVAGVIDVKHHGDRIYCMTLKPDGLISVLDDESLEQCSNTFLRLGNGPGETLSPIPFRQMHFYESNGELKATFSNMGTRLIELNLTASESSGTAVGTPLGEIPGELVGRGPISIIDDDLYFFQFPEDQRRVNRGIWKDGSIRYTPAQEQLNSFSLQESSSFLFNIFFSTCAYNPDKQRFVEASSMQNTINIYDLNGSFEKTVSINGPVDDYLALEKKGIDGVSMTFDAVQSLADCFVVLYHERPLSHPSENMPALLFFDWDGNPTMEIKLPFSVTSFDIDLEKKILCLADQNSEKVYVTDFNL